MKAIIFMMVFLGVANSSIQGEATCNLCQGLINTLEGIIEKKSETHVKTYLETLCEKSDGIVEFMCKKVIDYGIDKVVNLILDKIEPKIICQNLNIC